MDKNIIENEIMPVTLEFQIKDPVTQLEKQIARLGPWFHNLHLPDGTQTAPGHPLGDFPSFKWNEISRHLPEDMTGWKALDIGCNAGFYSFQLAMRGADVTGIDLDTHYLNQARWAARKYGLSNKVVFRKMQVYDIARIKERFDLILFMGVFYHLRYPLLALDIISRKFTRMMVFQTLTMPGDEVYDNPQDLGIDEREQMLEPGWPKMAFIEKRLAGDPTNWWAPNHSAVMALLRSCGLTIQKTPSHEIYICGRSKTEPEFTVTESELGSAIKGLFS